MKTLFSLIKVALIFLFIGGVFFLFINKTFIYETFKDEDMNGDGIPIRRFMYLLDNEDNNANFITPLSYNYLNEQKDSYLGELEYCYGKYYYDEDNNITITNYSIVDNNYYRKVNISYTYDNYCSEDYVLSDMWVYEYNNVSLYTGGDITSDAMQNVIDKIYSSNRVSDPVVSDYDSVYSLTVKAISDGEEYEICLEDYSDSELLVKKISNGVTQFAVYEVENVKDFLSNLERS